MSKFIFTVLASLIILQNSATAIEPSSHPRLQAIVDELVTSGLYSKEEINQVFAAAEFKQSVLDAMQSPAEYKLTWGKYRKIFIQDDRINQGVDFWLEHQSALDRAEQEYGVPASMIVAILGVESKFGRYKGKHKVLDSLVTLIVGFERRSKFFASELKEFLILTKENGMDPTEILGSYAGAVGFPQFISSSYRNYAVDFSGDGKTDLIDQVEDAIGSIANYFVENGWHRGEPVTSVSHAVLPQAVKDLASRKRKVKHTAAELRTLGAPLAESLVDDERLGVVMLNINDKVPDETKRDVYLVRAGDTACQIAEAHKVPCKELFRVNNLNQRGDIFRGQRLKLPAQALQPSAVAEGQKWQVSGAAEVANSSERIDETREIPRYFFTHHNFYVITRYNQSVLYAMAVQDLSTELAKTYEARRAAPVTGAR